MKISIVIPCYNEINTINQIVEKVFKTALPYEREIIVVDDGSTDGTRELLQKIDGEELSQGNFTQ